MSDDEFDAIPDDFADVEGVDWATLLAVPPTTNARPTSGGFPLASGSANLPCRPAEVINESAISHATGSISSAISSNSNGGDTSISSNYFADDDVMDSAFLAELDNVEQRALTRGSQGPTTVLLPNPAPSTSNIGTTSTPLQDTFQVPYPHPQVRNERQSSHYFPSASSSGSNQDSARQDQLQTPTVVPSKRPRSPSPMSPKRKGKMKAENSIEQILLTYEDELTCPICCDLFVASHVGNPCGHTFCGECGWQWHVLNKNKGCPCCRKNLNSSVPMIPNIAMDNTVEKHVKALALGGAAEWASGGKKLDEWLARKQAWKDGEGQRQQKTRRGESKQRVQANHRYPMDAIELVGMWFPEIDNEEEDPTYEDSDIELVPRRMVQRRRRGQGGSRAR
ncbi:hypothetical protein D9613_001652 [Agrocybe pediades]|uniref:RING-type domain-containing protein n=1 Tax=Agrocybe pediades TaxID=84607 RepID=A0A8H4R7A9_9AGAR|nr:hypothetical protein D9613_001652 [Agrocybe pediades]